uniref:Uncharacterized protein n=1 Tax=Triticum urartu TaxID=4572 RepID=A0A8R7TYB7_TRIUA
MASRSQRSRRGGSSCDLQKWGTVGTDSEARGGGSRRQAPRSCRRPGGTGVCAVVECWSCSEMLPGSTWRLAPVPVHCHAPSSPHSDTLSAAASVSSRLH